jgi:hypothetical protein
MGVDKSGGAVGLHLLTSRATVESVAERVRTEEDLLKSRKERLVTMPPKRKTDLY